MFFFIPLESVHMKAMTLTKEPFSKSQSRLCNQLFWMPSPIGITPLKRLYASQTPFYVTSSWFRTMHPGLVSTILSQLIQKTLYHSLEFYFNKLHQISPSRSGTITFKWYGKIDASKIFGAYNANYSTKILQNVRYTEDTASFIGKWYRASLPCRGKCITRRYRGAIEHCSKKKLT